MSVGLAIRTAGEFVTLAQEFALGRPEQKVCEAWDGVFTLVSA
jgi:hypothetical protein